MNNLTTNKKPVAQKPSVQSSVEVETVYTGQKPQFQQSVNKPQKVLSDVSKHTDL